MIKILEFKSDKSLNSEPILLELSLGTNVIIGPKGGGKSTLFDLLAGIKNNYVSDNVIKALKEHGFYFVRAIKFNNEEININQLSKKKEKEKLEDYKNRYDVIYQDDPIKKSLTSMSEIEKQKFDYLKEKIAISKSVNEFISKIRTLYNSFSRMNDYNKSNFVTINWTNTFKVNSTPLDDKLSLITKLNYKSNSIEQIINQDLSYLEDIQKILKDQASGLNKIEKTEFQSEIKDINFELHLQKNIEDGQNINNKINALILKRTKKIVKYKNISKAFHHSYKLMIDRIKQDNFEGSGLKSYEIEAKDHFKNLAIEIFNLKNSFESLLKTDQELKFDNLENQSESLTFKIKEKIILSEENIVEILKIVFYSPGSSINDVTKWLKTLLDKGIHDFDESKLLNAIARCLKDNVIVLADGKDYESLSLGQRSIYGLKYKFNKSIEDDLFLDQPEDNLDNFTISNEILKMIDQKKDNQIIIVTHNANIGILSKPQRVIVANLQNAEIPYLIGTIENNKHIVDSDSAHYLEGGTKFLDKRYNIINSKEEKK